MTGTGECSITMAQPGFIGRRAKWRVAVCVDPCLDLPSDGRSTEWRKAREAGVAAISYIRGSERDAENEAERMATSMMRRQLCL